MFTGSRAEYGLLSATMAGLRDRRDVRLQILVAGAHLSPEFGLTHREIEHDGFHIDDRVEMLLSTASPTGVAKSFGIGVMGVADALARLQPDLLVVLGDRYEALATATAAMLLRIPIAHIAGGETTEGAVDESMRHAITTMAHVHLVATDVFRRRVLQLGEDPARVWTVGAPGLDAIAGLPRLPRAALEEELGMTLARPLLLVTYHAVTGGAGDPAEGIVGLLAALEEIDRRLRGVTVVFTHPGADTGSATIADAIHRHARRRPERTRVYASLGRQRYLRVMAEADVVVGNSSSGLIEAPALGIPTVNVGERQRGRPRAASVIDCSARLADVLASLHVALDPGFRARARSARSPFGEPGAGERICEVLATIPLDGLLEKRFHMTCTCEDADAVVHGRPGGGRER